jgi:hypothetical protein
MPAQSISGSVYSQPQSAVTPQKKLTNPLGNGTSTELQTGLMIWDASLYGSQATVVFQYNPSSFEASYELQNTTVNATQMYQITSGEAALTVPMMQQVEFTLLFDRTFDLWGSVGNEGSSALTALGVDADVLALKQYTGMFMTASNAAAASASFSNAVPAVGQLSQGLMQPMLGYLYFSSTPNYGSFYYGYVDSWDVTYTHFTQDMVPMRCSCDVSFTLWPPPAQVAGAQQAGG